ncbi:SIMPL domain-containing protein [Pseudomonas sp. MAP12]|uniref:SIMPL domain-containing protein n=1 Tax=Geopseudomonas aromaticivorans TaxID=2849492 RepID=A0ABS6N1R3_9GAMM|nr:SIMPL domain-containing protein [Pseudomonas aromaticivorans]MBV2134477.1 SIMPL domain-containing protein [Pseudomonas aromaticivorans]
MPTLPRVSALLALGASLCILPALADEPPRYNQISLRAEVNREVAHDRMHVILYREAQHSDPAKLAMQITDTLNRAMARARTVKPVMVSLGSRQSFPVYDDQGRKVVAWRERAELRLESADFAALAQLSSALLDELQMADMHFSLSSDSRKQHEDQLIKEAVAAFKARAQLVSQAMGANSYKLVRLDLNASGAPRPPLMRATMAMKDMSMERAPVPQIEGGNSELAVNADGVIELQLP